MSEITALYRELDPLRPLGAEDESLYVNWQRELDPDAPDVKSRLVRSFTRNASPEHPIARLLTGHKGSGKTTELNRVAQRLAEGQGDKRVFVSTLFAQRWLDMEDVQPEDLVLQIVRQLVADLRDTGMELGETRLKGLFETLRDKLKGVQLESVDLGIEPLGFSFALKDFPTARREFREVLRGQLPRVFDLVNKELLPAARDHLKALGFHDLLLIVDDLDKIPQKPLADGRVTNHENLFLNGSRTLRALNCSLLLTVPIELAYSPAQARLKDDYGGSIATVPLVSIETLDGKPVPAGEKAMIEVLERRVARALGERSDASGCAEVFSDRDVLLRIVRLSGGHVRSLLVMLTELLDWVDELPIGGTTVDGYVPRAAKDMARGLVESDRVVLRKVRKSPAGVEDERFFDLLRNHYVFAYEAGVDDYWYGVNPLLEEIDL